MRSLPLALFPGGEFARQTRSLGRREMTYVITGATGEVGSRVVKQLLERHIRPRVLARSERKARSLFGHRVDVCVGDLAAQDSVRAAVQGAHTLFLVNVGPEIPE